MMEGQVNRATQLYQNWEQKELMLMDVFGRGGVTDDLSRQKYDFLRLGMLRIPRPTADEKLVLGLIAKSAAKLERQLYPNFVVRMVIRLKRIVYDRPMQAARLKQLKSGNLLSLSRDLGRMGVDVERLDLEQRLDSESPRLDIPMVSPYGTAHNFEVTLHLEKQQSGAYALKNYTAELKDPLGVEKNRSYTFSAASGINTREAVNLLQGRSVLKYHKSGEKQMGSKWLQLDLKQLDLEGKPVLREIGADYEFNIKKQIAGIASELEKWDLTSSRVLEGLEKGNQIALKRDGGETAYLEVNAIDRQVMIRDGEQRPIKLESLAADRKALVKERPRSLKLSKARNKQQDQSLAIS
jgi:hypothetical protein